MKVSTLILTFNEATNLPACLDALKWCDDIVVLDSGSTDETVAIARKHGARVITRPFDEFASQRNYGLDHGGLRHEWVLHLDADEVITPAFVGALEALRPDADCDAYWVASKTILFGRWLKYAGMYPSYQARIGRREALRFKQVGHGQREHLPPNRLRYFTEPYLHFAFSHGMHSWLQKHVRYAAEEARVLLATRKGTPSVEIPSDASGTIARRRRAKELASRLPLAFRPLARFVYVYLFKQGFRDGRAGLAYATMLAAYEGMTSIFAFEHLLATAFKLDADQKRD